VNYPHTINPGQEYIAITVGGRCGWLSSDAQAPLTSTPMSGRYAWVQAALLEGFDALPCLSRSAVTPGGQSYDAAAYQEAGADLQMALDSVHHSALGLCGVTRPNPRGLRSIRC
jgi:hypothetical protein